MKFKFIFLKVGIFSLNCFYKIIKMLKTKNKITFLSRQSDNITLDFKLISDEINKKMPEYKTIILCKKIKNKFLYSFHMIRQMYHMATSKIVIIDSYCICVSILKHKKKLKVIQIWHAIGSMKKFGYASIGMPEGSTKEIAKIMHMHENYDYALISSLSFAKDYMEGFKIEQNKIIEIPLPRVDLLVDMEYKKKVRDKYYKLIPSLKKKQNILYCGTFRRKEKGAAKKIKELINCINFDKYNFIYRPHPLSKVDIDDNRIIKNIDTTFEALFVADYVISDYSSIIYEAGLLNIPVYLYAFDWKEYKKRRTINFDIEHEVPTCFTDNPQEIIKAIESKKFNKKEFKEFVDKNVHIPNNGSLNAIIELLKKLLN